MPETADRRNHLHWHRPKLTIYRAANPKLLRLALNRYPGVVIGIAPQVAGWVLSLTWAWACLRQDDHSSPWGGRNA